MIKAIETEYSGCLFRSRLEAEHENRMFAMSAYGKTGQMINREYRKLMGDTLIFAVKEARQARFEHKRQ